MMYVDCVEVQQRRSTHVNNSHNMSSKVRFNKLYTIREGREASSSSCSGLTFTVERGVGDLLSCCISVLVDI